MSESGNRTGAAFSRADSVNLVEGEDARRDQILSLNALIRGCRRCHQAGYLSAAESVPLACDPEVGAPLPSILLVSQSPSRQATLAGKLFQSESGDTLRGWLSIAGIPPSDFYHRLAFSPVTKCYPGRRRLGKGDRKPTVREQALCRPWLDLQIAAYEPEIVLAVGSLAIEAVLGLDVPLAQVVGRAAGSREGMGSLRSPDTTTSSPLKKFALVEQPGERDAARPCPGDIEGMGRRVRGRDGQVRTVTLLHVEPVMRMNRLAVRYMLHDLPYPLRKQ